MISKQCFTLNRMLKNNTFHNISYFIKYITIVHIFMLKKLTLKDRISSDSYRRLLDTRCCVRSGVNVSD